MGTSRRMLRRLSMVQPMAEDSICELRRSSVPVKEQGVEGTRPNSSFTTQGKRKWVQMSGMRMMGIRGVACPSVVSV